jgi:hypothetical protein
MRNACSKWAKPSAARPAVMSALPRLLRVAASRRLSGCQSSLLGLRRSRALLFQFGDEPIGNGFLKDHIADHSVIENVDMEDGASLSKVAANLLRSRGTTVAP